MSPVGVRRVAAIDIGTNTVRLLIADVDASGAVQWVDRHATVTRLGQDIDSSGELRADAIARTTEVLRRYRSLVVSDDCFAVGAIATSAVRDASNRGQFVEAANAALGVRPRVVGGDEEAAIAFAGATGARAGEGPFLVIDPGGGSTEFVLGRTAPEYVVSVEIGSVRLSERSLESHPVAPGDLYSARSHAAGVLAAVELPEPPQYALGVAGTFTSLAAMHLDLAAYDTELVHGTVLTVDDLHELTDRLATMTIDDIAAIPSMDPARAPVMTGGAVVAEQSLVAVGVASVTVSEHDSLDGLAMALAAT